MCMCFENAIIRTYHIILYPFIMVVVSDFMPILENLLFYLFRLFMLILSDFDGLKIVLSILIMIEFSKRFGFD